MQKYSFLVMLSVQVIFALPLYAAGELGLEPPQLLSLPKDFHPLSKEELEQLEIQRKHDETKRCEENNGVWESYEDKPDIEYCLTPEAMLRKEKCLKYHGTWQPKKGWFDPNSPICINDYPDKYKICHHDTDCLSNFCVTTYDKSLEHGKCAASEAVMCQRENIGFEEYKKDIESGKPRKEVFCVE